MPDSATDASEVELPGSGPSTITDNLVKEVADRVFVLLLQELRIEQERTHQSRQATLCSRGGW
jgi:hypothetical protein